MITIIENDLIIVTKRIELWISLKKCLKISFEKFYYDGLNYILEIGFITICWKAEIINPILRR